jgi:hypothetical protein
MLTKSFVVNPYKRSIVVCQSKCLKRLFEEYDIRDDPDKYEAVTANRGNMVVMLFRQNPTPGVIAHEAVHAVNYIFQNIGQSLCVKNDETQAYLTEFIVNKVHKILKC